MLFAKRRLGDSAGAGAVYLFGLSLQDQLLVTTVLGDHTCCCEGPADPEVRRYIFALGQAMRRVCVPKTSSVFHKSTLYIFRAHFAEIMGFFPSWWLLDVRNGRFLHMCPWSKTLLADLIPGF